MPFHSIFNDVLGPVMVGPSSSHTAGPTRLGLLARQLLGEEPRHCRVVFDPDGSFATIYRTQGTDRGFVAGFLGLDPGDPQARHSLQTARQEGIEVEFLVRPLEGAEHPNTALVELSGKSRSVSVVGLSVGGGMVRLARVDGYPVDIDGSLHHILVKTGENVQCPQGARRFPVPGKGAILQHDYTSPPAGDIAHLQKLGEVLGPVAPVLPVPGPGVPPLFTTQEEASLLDQGQGLGGLSVEFEARRSGWTPGRVLDHAWAILQVMRDAASFGMRAEGSLVLTTHASPSILEAKRAKRLLGGPGVEDAIVIALAVSEASNSGGVVCAAPTAGSCGTVPGALLAAAEVLDVTSDELARALMAAGGAGVIIAMEATFAAEVAGCQAETGAASAMAAAGLVDLMGGTARQALGAASVALQNVLGLVCDPVAGLVEVPCFGRNAMGAANAFVAANMVLGGYDPLIPLEETARAMLDVGTALHADLRCTARGGLSVVPSAKRLAERLKP
ncbi:MAG: L-serine ammonia-lyase, iron-sulfur-dependent, subunit alpha [Bacillota bacterium]